MGFKAKKKGLSRKAPYLFQTAEMLKHFSWCINNGIGICVLPNWSIPDCWSVEITIKENISLDPAEYKGPEAIQKMYDYCKYYYDKHNKK